MDYVEVIGSPGVGKSAIVDALDQRWSRNAGWITDVRLLHGSPLVRRLASRIRRIRRFVRIFGLPPEPTQRWSEAAADFARLNPELVSHISEGMSSWATELDKSSDQVQSQWKSIHRSFAKVHLLWSRRPHETVVLDGGILKHASFVIEACCEDTSAREAIRNEAMPRAYVLVDASAETIAHRVETGPKRISGLQGRSAESLLQYCKVSSEDWRGKAETLREAGLEVLSLCSEREPEVNAAELERFLVDRRKHED